MLSKLFIRPVSSETLKVFYSYSETDTDFEFLDRLDKHLSLLKKGGVIESWHKKKILPGDPKQEVADAHLEQANLILVLVSIDFLASDYCFDIEMKRAMEKHAQGEARLIPILLRPVDWDATPFAKVKLKPLPSNGLPIVLWQDKDSAFAEVAENIRTTVERWDITIVASGSSLEWHLKMEGKIEDFTVERLNEIVEKLKRISGDESIEKVGLRTGSVILILIGSQAGFKRLKGLFREGKMSEELGVSVVDFSLIFGASMKHGVTIAPQAEASAEDNFFNEKMALPTGAFSPVLFKGIKLNPDSEDPFGFNFIVDTGDEGSEKASEASKILIDYFITSLTIEEGDMWVNLSAYEDNRMIPPVLGETQMGKELLSQDVMLKRLAASLTHPDTALGRKYWQSVYARAAELFGSSDIEIHAFHKVWLQPEVAQVYETRYLIEEAGDAENNKILKWAELDIGDYFAFVTNSKIKLMCEKDNVAIREYFKNSRGSYEKKNYNPFESPLDFYIPIFEDLILPVIEKEVNEGYLFAPIRQIYQCMILATWVKNKFKDHPAYKKYINSNNPVGTFNPIIRSIKSLPGIKTEEEPKEDKPSKILEHVEEVLNEVEAFWKIKGANAAEAAINLSKVDKTLEKVVENYGFFHPKSIHLNKIKAEFLRRLGRPQKALPIYQDLSKVLSQIKGKDHEESLQIIHLLADTQLESGEEKSAIENLREVVRIRENHVGAFHPLAIESKEKLADALKQIGEQGEAEQLSRDISHLKISQAEFGKEPGVNEMEINRVFYWKYLELFKKGVFQCTRKEFDANANRLITRNYFSGAIVFDGLARLLS